MKFIVQSQSPDTIYKVTVYEHKDYGGRSQELPVGRYNMDQLSIGNDIISSIKIPTGVIVTVYEHADFEGKTKLLTEDTTYIGKDFNDKTSSIVVELAVKIFKDANYEGKSQTLPLGSYNMKKLDIGNDKLSSIKIPLGLMVTLFEHKDFNGRMKTFIEDTAYVGDDFNDITSGILVSVAGVDIPDTALKFGDKISLKSYHGKYMTAKSGDGLKAYTDTIDDSAKFEIVRSGNTKNDIFVSFGDIISLKSCDNKYITAESQGAVYATVDKLNDWEKFTLLRSGDTQSESFFCIGDTISLFTFHKKYLSGEPNGRVYAGVDKLDDWEKWTVSALPVDVKTVTPEDLSSNICGADECSSAVCGAAICGAAACGTAVGGDTVCGVAAYALVICGVAACAADACVAAACAGDICGGQACGGAACGEAVCGADACGGYAGGIGLCGADVCGANVCGINLCPADACGVDACGIDLIPIIPGI